MKLMFVDGKTSTAVYCKDYRLGYIQPNKYVRREQSTEFTGMGKTIYYNNLEDAKAKLADDLYSYFEELCTDEE